MPIAVDPRQAVEYVLKAERDSADATRFPIRPPTLAQERRIMAAFDKSGLEGTTVACRECMDRPSGLLDAEGNEVEWPTNDKGQPTDDALQLLSMHDRAEIATAIMARGRVSEDEAEK